MGGLGLAVAASAAAWFAWPRPIQADLATVVRGPIEVTVDEEAKTRVRHVYTVSAPIAGKVLRISHPYGTQNPVSVHVGDSVTGGETIVAVMQPTTPAFIDIRSREELQSAVAAAEAAINLAQAEVKRMSAALDFAQGEVRRAEALSRTDSISARSLEKARFDLASAEAALASTRAQLEVRRSERAAIVARLMDPASVAAPSPGPDCCVQLRAPITGRVLRIVQDSEAVVQAGAPLLEIGDPLDLEIVAELLSTDAVRVQAGSPVRVDGWGGAPLQGRVVRVEPAGFMKVSALGIEEQRVRVIVDFSEAADTWKALGHDYRVIVHITVAKAEDAVSVPVAALFRKDADWAVFAVRDGRAQMTVIRLGQRNGRVAEVLSGLASGDRIVLHPSDRVANGVAVVEREASR
jgi:HlyD family secretion protein